MAELAQGMKRLRAFVHVSTAYTNCDHPRRAVVHERVYTLLAPSGKPVDIDALAAELASLPPDAAEAAVRAPPSRPAPVQGEAVAGAGLRAFEHHEFRSGYLVHCCQR